MRPTRTLLIIFSLAILAFATSCNKTNSNGGVGSNNLSFTNESITARVQVPFDGVNIFQVEAAVYEASSTEPVQIVQICEQDVTQYNLQNAQGLMGQIHTTPNTTKIALSIRCHSISGSSRYKILSRSDLMRTINYKDL